MPIASPGLWTTAHRSGVSGTLPANLDLQSGAADPRRLSCANQAKDAFERFGFIANAGLALIVGQAVQTTGIKI
jgi:hypothetical protein